jgi:hypothetical protein
MKNLLKSLSEFQNEVPVIHEETKGYNYSYSNLNTIFKVIKPLLKKHGLGFTQFLNGNSLNTYLFHIESGEKLESTVEIPNGVALKGQNDYQALGSGITYLRRYSLSCMLGLITDKDIDACGTQEPKKPVKKQLTQSVIDSAVEKGATLEVIKQHYTVTKEQEQKLIKMLK